MSSFLSQSEIFERIVCEQKWRDKQAIFLQFLRFYGSFFQEKFTFLSLIFSKKSRKNSFIFY